MKKFTCIACPVGCSLTVTDEKGEVKVTGARCPHGIKFAKQEIIEPKRMLTTTVKITNRDILLPVKSSDNVSKDKFTEIMVLINKIEVQAPIKAGDIIIKNILDLDVDIIATRSIL